MYHGCLAISSQFQTATQSTMSLLNKAFILLFALVVPINSTSDDILLEEFCNRQDLNKIISICYDPAVTSNHVVADGKLAYTAASKGVFVGSANEAGTRSLAIKSRETNVLVSCWLSKLNAVNSGIQLMGLKSNDWKFDKIANNQAEDLFIGGSFEGGVVIQAKFTSSFRCSWKPAFN